MQTLRKEKELHCRLRRQRIETNQRTNQRKGNIMKLVHAYQSEDGSFWLEKEEAERRDQLILVSEYLSNTVEDWHNLDPEGIAELITKKFSVNKL